MKIVHEGAGSSQLRLYDFEPTPDRICEDVLSGLSRPQKVLPSKYFYDDLGAELFERIMELEAYYPTRTEIGILQAGAGEISDRIGARARLVEFGSGSGEKTWILLRHLRDLAAYIPVDISRAQLIEFALRVAEVFPELPVVPVCADYTAEFELPAPEAGTARSIAFFPGSTIGNFEPAGALGFLRGVRRLVGPDGGMLLGLDLRKEVGIIERAYNDPEGVTAEFNLNILRRINRECSADFDLGAFRHRAVFDEDRSRIEMRLISTRDQTVHVAGDGHEGEGASFHFTEGEHILTEYSHKYTLDDFGRMAADAGWAVEKVWTDSRQWFAVVLLR